MTSNKLTYSNSGVNISKADSFVKFISSLAKKSSKSGDFKNIALLFRQWVNLETSHRNKYRWSWNKILMI